jgi:hypothetical protein
MANEAIYIHKNNEQLGPYDSHNIDRLIKIGSITVEDLAWAEGQAEWVPLKVLWEKYDAPDISSRINDNVEKIDATLSRLLGDEQSASTVSKIVNKVKGLLTNGEDVLYVAIQKKPIMTISPDSILLTNRRFMIVRPKFLSMTFSDYQWREVSDVHLSEQFLTSTISCRVTNGEAISIDSIPKKQAKRIYSISQEMEEKMFEHRRQLNIEEKRAGAGGVVINSPLHSPQSNPEFSDDPVAVLGKLKQLLEAGLIEQSEFDSKKQEVLSKM